MRIFQIPEGMPLSIFHNKYSRKKADGTYQTWAERVNEVVEGNFSLVDQYTQADKERTHGLASAGVMPFSGRHLQHGDMDQKNKAGESFTNCSTSMFSFTNFWLLLKGSGVGSSYDGDIRRVNWDHMPNVRFVLQEPDMRGEGGHPDYQNWIEGADAARHKYGSESSEVRWFTVGDSAEGWSKVVEILETAAFQEKHSSKLFIFDFSGVREKGAPIVGQQGRPSSGPVPLIRAMLRVAGVKGAGMRPWKQAMFVDHYLADCVAVGGVRRSARIATKYWKDRDVIEFIDIKRGGFLHTANNSVIVDAEFWAQAASPAPSHGRRVFEAMVSASYFDRTGEPGFINADKLAWSDKGMENIQAETLFSDHMSRRLNLHPRTHDMVREGLRWAKKKKYPFLVNPCAEELLAIYGGYCVIADIGMCNVEDLQEALDAARLSAQFLIRTNTMPYLYQAEVARTNRIGVSMTGIHEFAAKHFDCDFHDLIAEQPLDKAQAFWDFLLRMRQVVTQESIRYSEELGVQIPHTFTTLKPAGTISKLLACTEGGHLPAFAYYLRWVQYAEGSDELADLIRRGYPVRDISHQYAGQRIVGFPTKLPIADLLGDRVVLAGEATPEEQYRWVRRMEEYWFGEGENTQFSYSLKYDPAKVSFEQYRQVILENQPEVRCCSMMPEVDESAFAYLPEESITEAEYSGYVENLDRVAMEGYDSEALACASGACPIELDLR